MHRFLLLLAFLAAFLSRAPLSAETLVIQTFLGFTPPTETPQPFVVPGFDPNLGTVNSVSMKVVPRMWTRYSNENTGFAGTGLMSVTGRVTISNELGTQLFTDEMTRAHSVALPSFDGVIDFAGTSGSFVQFVETEPFHAPYVARTRREIAPFVGVGIKTFFIHRQGVAQDFACDTANWSHMVDARTGAEIEITINYTPTLN